jgi:hypothetical protein
MLMALKQLGNGALVSKSMILDFSLTKATMIPIGKKRAASS